MADSPFEFRSSFNEKWSPETRQLVRILANDSRISVSDLAKKLQVSRKTAKDRLKKAEAELGMKYTIELDEEKLGLSNPHLILIKFSKKPDYEHVASVLQQSPIPQLAVTIKGNYDMFIYANASSTKEYVYWDKTTQVQLAKYGVLWYPSDLAYRHIGFFPLKSALIESLEIPKKYKDLLILLNENSRISFSEISKRLGMHFNTVAYNFKKLVKMGYVRRFTAVLSPMKGVSLMSLFGKYVISEGFEDDSMAMRKEVTFIDDKMPIVSRCLLSSQLVGSFDFFFVGAYDDDEMGYRRLIQYYKRRYRRHRVKAFYGSISSMLFGNFPIRNLDTKSEFRMVRWDPSLGSVETKGAFAKHETSHT